MQYATEVSHNSVALLLLFLQRAVEPAPATTCKPHTEGLQQEQLLSWHGMAWHGTTQTCTSGGHQHYLIFPLWKMQLHLVVRVLNGIGPSTGSSHCSSSSSSSGSGSGSGSGSAWP